MGDIDQGVVGRLVRGQHQEVASPGPEAVDNAKDALRRCPGDRGDLAQVRGAADAAVAGVDLREGLEKGVGDRTVVGGEFVQRFLGVTVQGEVDAVDIVIVLQLSRQI